MARVRDRVAEYAWLARTIATSYFVVGGDHDDVVQEAMIGLWKADQDYDPSRSSFIDFARLCIHRQLFTAMTAARRMKHEPLSKGVRETTVDGMTVDAVDLILDVDADPALVLERREEVARVVQLVNGLSPLERHALTGIARGERYVDVADAAGVGVKSIDNAVVRARDKLAA